MNTIRVLLADDHSIVREGIGRLLESFGNIQIVGQCCDGHEAVRLCAELKPDLVVLDITMPRQRGVEAIKDIRHYSPQTRIIVLSMHSKEKYIKDSLRQGASAYLVKESAVNELKSAIDYVLHGQVYLSPAIAKNVVIDWLSPQPQNGDGGPLTFREKEIVKLLAEGHSNKEVAAMLFISPKTVETHRYRINEKLHLGNVANLVRYAIKEGLTSVE